VKAVTGSKPGLIAGSCCNHIVRPRVAKEDKPSELATEENAGTKEFIDILKKE
jgi:hypothetical protein